ncbi:daptide biosynthesis RiPP recognition protein [Cellulomonas chengniuliangii]|uniref:Coenzyme PQQ synthesis protein D (PqqD) n=1 Tax=Cellulomonas chengniuliangii TaxID=2968084 RepID=A0ABY5L4U7_9CELL|nr:daptide biosynthesis RiPP recognition protein [Cellulomonas chengniuliangii]MCC2308127.1 hypothetical protein [Cellulomonas chengniuliangii]MCC2317135.1 hypothetical protein [Cellulomonas chengniuliangii]UUI76521.1 hypothetical protein NP064_06445 [Cellulomonas chengniuliangii]
MTPQPEVSPVEQVARRMNAWVRGDAGAGRTIVTENPGSLAWLADPATGLVDDTTVVVSAGPRRQSVELPDAPGLWVRAIGAVAAPGDDLALGSDFYLETLSYAELPAQGVAGPTAVRLTTAADALLLAADASAAAESGLLPPALLNPSVELADQCAVVGDPTCGGRRLERLAIDRDGVVRAAPGGRPLGRAGDDPAALAAAAAGDDPCVAPEVRDALATVDGTALAHLVSALRVVRRLSRSQPSAWRVVAGDTALLEPARSRPVRPDRLLLTDGAGYVVSDGWGERAFRVSRGVAEVVEAVLATATADEAAALVRAHGTASASADDIERFVESCRARGMDLARADA